MSTHKSIDRICVVVTVLALIITILFMNGSVLGVQAADRVMGYEDRLFDTSKVHTIEIVMDGWDEFIASCEDEVYSACTVVIDNEAYKNVGIRGKGNTSLSTVSSMGSQRYSFKIEFDQYEDGKSYHGLDKLSLNNIIQDNTYMKDYLSYRLMDAFDVDTPLCSFVYITVNGEDWGLYLAVEGVEDSFLQRNYGRDTGELYKPDSMSFGGGGPGNGRDFNMDDFLNRDSDAEGDTPGEGGFSFGGNMPEGFDAPQFGGNMPDGFAPSQLPSDGEMPGNSGGFGGGMPEGLNPSQFPSVGEAPGNFDFSGEMPDGFDPSQFGGSMPEGINPFGGEGNGDGEAGFSFNFGGIFGGMGSSDVKLQYIDDDPDSYSNIFDNAKTDVTKADQARLIASLKKLSEGEDIESVVDVEEVIRYFVVHNFVCNGDSYTGSIIHNYYLHESNGQLSMIPWDYNLAFGSFQSADATDSVNDPIDTPLSVSDASDRPMWGWIAGSEEYTALYHVIFEKFLDSVDITGIINEAYSLIKSYVEKDPTAFCSYEEFEKGVDTLRRFCALRIESIRGQLNGTISPTDAGQRAESTSLIDASGITISDMGSMGGGGFGGRFSEENDQLSPGRFSGFGSGDDENAAQAFGNGGFAMPGVGTMPNRPDSDSGEENASATERQMPDRKDASSFDGPGQGDFPAQQTNAQGNGSKWLLVGVSTVVLLAGLLFAVRYKRE